MLPPFVPPSARMPAQPLPLITEFVFDRGEPPIEPSFSAESWEPEQSSGGIASADHEPQSSLPSIDEFLMRTEPEEVPCAVEEPAQEPAQESAQEPAPIESSAEPTETSAEMTNAAAVPSEQETSEAPVQAPVEAPVGAVAEPAAEPIAEQVSEQPTHVAPETEAPEAEPISDSSTETWMAEERNSFDWSGVANLTQAADEERRASDEWSATDWDRQGASPQDHVVSLMAQVARRVRSGELHVHAMRNMTAEAALAAVLAALLAEPDTE